jgi:hypothetical protein
MTSMVLNSLRKQGNVSRTLSHTVNYASTHYTKIIHFLRFLTSYSFYNKP